MIDAGNASPAGSPIQWFDSRDSLSEALNALHDADQVAIDTLSPLQRFVGYCPACNRGVSFAVTGSQEPPGVWRNFQEGMICSCGTNGRTRLATLAWRQIRQTFETKDNLIFERVTPLFSRFVEEDSNLNGCEFLGYDKSGGAFYDINGVCIRHEDMTALSCATNSLDLIMHFDVLEHVPDHRAGLRECFRALRPGGKMLFTLPFFPGLDRHLVRAELKDGALISHLPDAYHGNPVGGGALVFIHPGWELLEDLSSAGFVVAIGLTHCLGFGIVSNGCPYPDGKAWPLVFLATKPA